MRSATGHLSIAARWLSYDSGRPADARSLYNEAPDAARIADDPALEGHAFGCLSLLARYRAVHVRRSPQPRVAAAGAEQAVLLHVDAFARNRALYTADIAIQHAVRERPEPEAAADAAARVLAYLPEVRSDRLTLASIRLWLWLRP
ncbi:hypothetical protein AB0I77_31500 [Streptomyces sp. NPDC050619]|uniref:hypothetical protein n=1 Tax=Streptomyces sp. NPDC050619 TaxID=3157214 RepID=UPI0034183136